MKTDQMKEKQKCVISPTGLWCCWNEPVCESVHYLVYKSKIKVHVVWEISADIRISSTQEAVEHGTAHTDDHRYQAQEKEEQTGVFTHFICTLIIIQILHTRMYITPSISVYTRKSYRCPVRYPFHWSGLSIWRSFWVEKDWHN